MNGLRATWIWFRENWLYGVVAWLAFFLSLGITAIFAIPILLVLTPFGFELGAWTEPFGQLWQIVTLETSNGRWIIFSILFFPFVFRNFLKFMSYFHSLEPSDWKDGG